MFPHRDSNPGPQIKSLLVFQLTYRGILFRGVNRNRTGLPSCYPAVCIAHYPFLKVTPVRFELTTHSLKGCCIYRLSYDVYFIEVLQGFEPRLALPVPALKTQYVTIYTREPYVTPARFELSILPIKSR